MHAAVRGVVKAAADSPDDVCILDTEASTEHLLVSTAKHADAMFAVVEPYFTSLETGRRITMLAKDLSPGTHRRPRTTGTPSQNANNLWRR